MSNWDKMYDNTKEYSEEYVEDYDSSSGANVMVSIICTTYNHGKYIEKALLSLVTQETDFKYEIIVHDDASTDNTATIIRKFQEQYPEKVFPIIQEKNQMSQGVKIVREFVLPKCKGKYIAFLEGDDYWCGKGRLQRQVDIMENHPDVVLCLAKVQYMNADGEPLNQIMPQENNGFKEGIIPTDLYCSRLWMNNAYFHTSSFLMKRQLMIEQYRYQFPKYTNGDHAWLRLALLLGKIYYIEEVLACRRMMTENSWNKWFHDASIEIKNQYSLKAAMGDALFDAESNGSFHQFVSKRVFNMSLPSIYCDRNGVVQAWNTCHLTYRDLQGTISRTDAIKYFVTKYFSFLLPILHCYSKKRQEVK